MENKSIDTYNEIITILGDSGDSISIDFDFNGEDTRNLSDELRVISLYDSDSVSPLDLSNIFNNTTYISGNTSPWGNLITGSGGGGGSNGAIYGAVAGSSGGGGLGSVTTGHSYNWNQTNWPSIGQINPGEIHVQGDANFEGDIKVKGKSILESLEKIEEKLAIFRPNEELEKKWDKLRELRNQYVEMEKDIIEKEKIWETLKK